LVLREGLERVTVLALDEIPEVIPHSLDIALLTMRDRITVRQGFEKVADYFLGQVYLCDRSEELFELRLRYPAVNFLAIDQKTLADAQTKNL